MQGIIIRDAAKADYPAIVKLNADAVEYTSIMDLERLKHLASLAAYLRVAETEGRVVAFLLAMQNSAAYENDNFDWFAERYEKFIYVDRVVVDRAYHGRKIGTLLYEDLFAFTRQCCIPLVTCEINSVPSNEPSARFHSCLGFNEVGSQWLGKGQKKVSMQAFRIS